MKMKFENAQHINDASKCWKYGADSFYLLLPHIPPVDVNTMSGGTLV